MPVEMEGRRWWGERWVSPSGAVLTRQEARLSHFPNISASPNRRPRNGRRNRVTPRSCCRVGNLLLLAAAEHTRSNLTSSGTFCENLVSCILELRILRPTYIDLEIDRPNRTRSHPFSLHRDSIHRVSLLCPAFCNGNPPSRTRADGGHTTQLAQPQVVCGVGLFRTMFRFMLSFRTAGHTYVLASEVTPLTTRENGKWGSQSSWRASRWNQRPVAPGTTARSLRTTRTAPCCSWT